MDRSITARIDAITKVAPEYRGTILPAPRACKVELSATCNLTCAFCAHSLNKTRGEMDRALYSRIIRELHAAGVVELGVFFVGESALLPWLPEAIAEAKAVGFEYVFLTTNGTVATPDKVKAWLDAGLNSLKFSLNFCDEEQFAKVTGASPRLFRKAIENFKAARAVLDEGGYDAGLYASSIKFDGEQGEKMAAIVDEIRPYATEFYWLPLYNMSGASKAAGWKPEPGNPGRLDAMRSLSENGGCWSVFTEGHITVDGGLAACCFGNGLDGALKMADLKEVSFMEGWNSERYQALRRAHLEGRLSESACADCASS